MIRPHSIDARYDFGIVRETYVGDPLLEARTGGDADKQLEFPVCGAKPQSRNQKGEQDGADRIDPPAKKGAAEGG